MPGLLQAAGACPPPGPHLYSPSIWFAYLLSAGGSISVIESLSDQKWLKSVPTEMWAVSQTAGRCQTDGPWLHCTTGLLWVP